MMNDQEMQFADPEWRPGQYGAQAGTEPEPFIPQPVQRERPEQSNGWEEPVPERVYTAQEPPPYQQFQQPQMSVGGLYGQARPRRRRSIWPWIIAALILLSLIGGSMQYSFNSFDHHMGMDRGMSAQPALSDQTKQFNVGDQPIITITGASGTVNVQTSNSAHEVVVHTEGPGQSSITQTDANSVSVNTSNNPDFADVSVTVTVPTNANLVIHTTDGDVNVDGVSGQLSVITGGGSIGLTNVQLSGNSTVQTTDGDITFNGQLASSGTSQFSSSTGSIDLTLPQNSAFQMTATTNTGDIHSDFSSLTIQQTSNGPGAVLHGSTGSSPQATVIVNTDSSPITIHSR